MKSKILLYLIFIIIFTTILSARVFGETIENCCDGLDNDGDGAIDAADSDCQGKSVNLTSGRNSVCWSTPVPYPNNFIAFTGDYRCPSGQIVTTIELTVNTEAGYDKLQIMKPLEGTVLSKLIAEKSGALGNITVDVSNESANVISFTFTSDASVVPSGGVARVRAITCASPSTSPPSPPPTGAENCCDGVDVTLN
jgi:hypothetical protein